MHAHCLPRRAHTACLCSSGRGCPAAVKSERRTPCLRKLPEGLGGRREPWDRKAGFSAQTLGRHRVRKAPCSSSGLETTGGPHAGPSEPPGHAQSWVWLFLQEMWFSKRNPLLPPKSVLEARTGYEVGALPRAAGTRLLSTFRSAPAPTSCPHSGWHSLPPPTCPLASAPKRMLRG